ncbi:hypothetical protein AMECASPLE_026161 [Ameca splendens]|uniref:Uncharacterized protein n=1 Tax=Ameca splendens TaxID=208324 RepID=A0ABV1ADT5_9TELE
MNSDVSKGLGEQRRAEFNPQAKTFVSNTTTSAAQMGLTAAPGSAPDVRPKVFYCKTQSHVQEQLQYRKQPLDVTVGPYSKLDGLLPVKVNSKLKTVPVQSTALQVTHNAQTKQQLDSSLTPTDTE